MKRVLYAIVILCMSVALFAGGVKESQKTSTGVEGPVKLTFLTAVNVDTEGVDVNDSPYVQFIEKKFNVDIEIINEPTQYAEKLNTTMASGSLPDYFNVLTKNELMRWADEGLALSLDSYLPSYPALQEQIMPLAWDLAKYEGQIYGVPLLRYDSTPLMTFVRKSWLDKLGIDPQSVKTSEDWYNMLHAFTYNDPDGNGKNDTYGLAASQDSFNAAYLTFLDAFNGATAQVIDGKVIPYYLTPGYKDYLKFMSRLYKEKILDPTYLVTSNQQLWDNVANEKVGAFLWFWMTTELRTKGIGPETFVAMTPPLRPDGSQSFYKYTSPVRTYTAISSTAKHPEKILEILNWACTEEGGVFVFAGIEGLDYDKDSSGRIVIREDRRGKNTSLRFIILGGQKPKVDTPILQDIMAQAWGNQGLAFLEKANISGGYDELEMLAPYFPELALYDLEQPVNEFRDLAIMGRVDVDTEWNAYVKRMMNAGAEKKIELMTDWYDTEYRK